MNVRDIHLVSKTQRTILAKIWYQCFYIIKVIDENPKIERSRMKLTSIMYIVKDKMNMSSNSCKLVVLYGIGEPWQRTCLTE